MAQVAFIEALIKREKRDATAVQQKGDDLFILHPASAHFVPDLPDGDTPPSQELPLTLRKVFIQNDHAAGSSTTYSFACSINACIANRTASAIASLDTLPRHSSTIVSQAIPLATCSSTCRTMIRVPQKVG